jgi:hypothetical protein
MDLLHTQLLLQSISSLAIATGIIVAAVQFRHWRKVAHVSNFTKLVEMQMELRKMRVDDPSLAKVYKHDVEGMANDQEIREYFMNLMQVSIFEIVWFSHINDMIPDDYWDSWVKRMRDIATEESFQKMVGSPSMKILHDDFQKYLEDLAAGVRAKTPRK